MLTKSRLMIQDDLCCTWSLEYSYSSATLLKTIIFTDYIFNSQNLGWSDNSIARKREEGTATCRLIIVLRGKREINPHSNVVRGVS